MAISYDSDFKFQFDAKWLLTPEAMFWFDIKPWDKMSVSRPEIQALLKDKSNK